MAVALLHRRLSKRAIGTNPRLATSAVTFASGAIGQIVTCGSC